LHRLRDDRRSLPSSRRKPEALFNSAKRWSSILIFAVDFPGLEVNGAMDPGLRRDDGM